MATGPTKQELQELVDQLGTKLADMLDPALTREELVQQVQELDDLVNGSDEDEDEDQDEDQDEDEQN